MKLIVQTILLSVAIAGSATADAFEHELSACGCGRTPTYAAGRCCCPTCSISGKPIGGCWRQLGTRRSGPK